MRPRQARFVESYIKTSNATQAAIDAGYSAATAHAAGGRLKKHPAIMVAIKKALDKYEISAERVLRELALCGFSNLEDYTRLEEDKRVVDFSATTRDQMAAVAEITEDTTGGSGDGERKVVLRTKVKLYDKIKALELLGKHLKLYTEKIEHSGLEGLAEKIAAVRKRKSGVAIAS